LVELRQKIQQEQEQEEISKITNQKGYLSVNKGIDSMYSEAGGMRDGEGDVNGNSQRTDEDYLLGKTFTRQDFEHHTQEQHEQQNEKEETKSNVTGAASTCTPQEPAAPATVDYHAHPRLVVASTIEAAAPMTMPQSPMDRN
jgi:hypothetical protein